MAASTPAHVIALTNLSLRYPDPPISTGLRGSHLSCIAWSRFLLQDSKSCHNAYDKSFDVSKLDYFLSHSWSASGNCKRLGIIVTFYLSFPLKLLVILSTVITLIIYFVVPHRFSCLTAILLGYMIFAGALAATLLTFNKKETAFLDKCCILQTDREAKLRGISRLSDYLRVSDKFVILWSPDYLKRLWCVYELARFLETHETKDVIIINLKHVEFCAWMVLGQVVGIIIPEVLKIYQCEYFTYNLLLNIMVWYCASLWVTVRSAYYMDTTLAFQHMVRTFKTSNAKCSDTADEPLLLDLIKKAYGSIESFEVVVRNLYLGDDELSHSPTWLFSKTTLRMLCLPFIPYIIGLSLLSIFFTLDRTWVPMSVIGAPATVASTPLKILYLLHGHTMPRILLCCQPLIFLLAGYKLSIWGYRKHISQTLAKACIVVPWFLYIWMRAVLGGRSIFYLIAPPDRVVELLDKPIKLYFSIAFVILVMALVRRAYRCGK